MNRRPVGSLETWDIHGNLLYSRDLSSWEPCDYAHQSGGTVEVQEANN